MIFFFNYNFFLFNFINVKINLNEWSNEVVFEF